MLSLSIKLANPNKVPRDLKIRYGIINKSSQLVSQSFRMFNLVREALIKHSAEDQLSRSMIG